MRVPYVKPESALQRAEELLEVNAPLEALNVLHNTLSARRSRNFVAVSLEPLVLKFLTLAVNHRRGLQAREGLHYYKKLVQSSSVTSVEKVVQHFLQAAESQVKTVRARHSKQDGSELMIQTIEDLETPDTFETVFSAMVTSLEEGGTMVIPKRERDPCTASIAFLWEAYRMVLDLLRNNAKFEMLYQHAAKKAFDFCVKYKRKNEFRRLSDALNIHLQSLHRPQQPAMHQRQPLASINLSDPDVLQRYIDTRFLQLQTASDLELWQESFRSAEDICGLLLKAADAIAPNEIHLPSTASSGLLPYALFANKKHGTKLMQILIQYYEKLTQIFAYSEDPTFLAAAWNEYYSWTVNAKSTIPISEETQHKLASYVVLTALSSPVLPIPAASDLTQRNHRKERLTKMLGWSHVPDRALLLADITKKNILSYAHPVIQELYRILEADFHPLTTASRLRAFLPQVQAISEFQSYLPALISITTTQLLNHLAKFYTCISFEHLLSLVQISLNPPMSLFDLEKLLVQFHRVSAYEVRTDHSHQSFSFQEKISSPPRIDLLLQLPLFQVQNDNNKSILFQRARESMEKEHLQVHERQEEIEKRKQYLENFDQRQLDQERTELLRTQQEERESLQRKLAEATRQKEIEKIKREQDAVKKSEAKKLSDSMKEKAGITIKKSESSSEIGREELLIIQENILSKERESVEQELTQVMRKLDHMERAIRKEEIPLLEKTKETEKVETLELTMKLRKKALEAAKERHAQALVIMKRVQRMRKESQVYRRSVEEERKEHLTLIRNRAEAEFSEAKKKRREEVRVLIREKLEAEKAMKRIAREEEKMKEEARKKQEEEKKALDWANDIKQKQEAGGTPWVPKTATLKSIERKKDEDMVRSQKHSASPPSPPSSAPDLPPTARGVEMKTGTAGLERNMRQFKRQRLEEEVDDVGEEVEEVKETKEKVPGRWVPRQIRVEKSESCMEHGTSDMKQMESAHVPWLPAAARNQEKTQYVPSRSKEVGWRPNLQEQGNEDAKETGWIPTGHTQYNEDARGTGWRPNVQEQSNEDAKATGWRPRVQEQSNEASKEVAWRSAVLEQDNKDSSDNGWRGVGGGGSSQSRGREIGSAQSNFNKGNRQSDFRQPPERTTESSVFNKSRKQPQTDHGDIVRGEKK